MDAIFSSVDKCPSLLRLALRQLWLRVEERFKDPEYAVREKGGREGGREGRKEG